MTLKERLIKLSGHDYRIVEHCDTGSQNEFFLMGLSIPVIFLICCASSFITFWQTFDNPFVATVLSLFFAWMIMNLYRLLLQTFGRNPLPEVDKKTGKFISRLIRLMFVSFIAAMVSKPLESVLYKDYLDLDIMVYKASVLKSTVGRIELYNQRQIDEIKQLVNSSPEGGKMVEDRLNKRQHSILQINSLINSSGFFLQRIRFLCTKHRSCWWITFFFLLVFLYPLALKYHLKNCSYYQLRSAVERRKVELSYYVLRKRYASLFEKLYRRRINLTNRYEDPPYNTLPKQEPRFLSEQEFITELYHV